MANETPEYPRTFVKKVGDGDEELVRTVNTAADEVGARYDGYQERPKASKSSSSGSKTSSSSSAS